MTSRLKRKLENSGIDASSSKVNESFCLIGTPLPPLDKVKDQNEFVPVWKQDVRDDQGRRRLHGAFTGGFSAGYFNTVGSKEGWAPATFKSSRDSRGKAKAARPEDFMDEEDLEELRNSRQIVDQTEEMDLLGGTQGELSRRGGGAVVNDDERVSVVSRENALMLTKNRNSPIIKALADSLLPAPNDSAGAKLLRKMGWRPGQGVGPRVTYAQLRAQDLQSSAPNQPLSARAPEEMDAEDDEAKKHTFAPRDTNVMMFRPKEDQHGLGFVPGMTLTESVARDGEKSGANISAGFGLGALNDADDDDLDVYDSFGPSSSRGRGQVAYDAFDSGRKVTLGAQRETYDRRQPSKENRPAESRATDTFHDGRPVLPGFALADKPVVEDTWFKLPDVPKGWKPDPSRVWAAASAASSSSGSASGPGRVHDHHAKARFQTTGQTLAEQRGAQLGESGLKDQKPRSVFDYLSEKDRARLQNFANAPSSPSPSASASAGAPASSTPAPAPSPSVFTMPTVESPMAQAALRGYQPFTSNPAKQARYTAYLKSQLHASSSAPPTRLPDQTTEEYSHELQEFAQSARVFKPMSGAMASRFTNASIIEGGPKVTGGLHTPAPAPPTSSSDEGGSGAGGLKRMEVEETPKQHAARMGMYGPLTREVSSWAPARLLCKRFGVKDPRVDPAEGASSTADAGSAAGIAASAAAAWEVDETSAKGIGAPPASTSDARSTSGPKDISNIGLGEDDEQGKDTLTYQRPAMDIFKAIFASDAEDSDDDDGDEDDEKDVPGDAPSSTGLLAPTAAPTPALAPADEAEADGPVDLASFKPKFVPKAKRDSGRPSSFANDIDSHSKSEKKKKSSKSRTSLVSFGMDEDAGEGLSLSVNTNSDSKHGKKKRKDKDKDRSVNGNGDGEKKKRRRDSEGDGVDVHAKRIRPSVGTAITAADGEDDEDEWVEKEAPPPPPGPASQTAPEAPRKFARPRASDFM